MERHPPVRVSAYVKLLRRAGAPVELIADFEEIVAIDDQIASEPEGYLEHLDNLLFDVCRRFNFSKVFDREGLVASFRPCLLHDNLDDSADCATFGASFHPVAEQAYRRGYDQGFAEANRLVKDGNASALDKRSEEIHRWRIAKVLFGATRPGASKPFSIALSYRTSIAPKLRWQVLTRDGHRCVACGASADDGTTLHVDHVVSLYNGGSNETSNLQTLCAPCNLGKGKD